MTVFFSNWVPAGELAGEQLSNDRFLKRFLCEARMTVTIRGFRSPHSDPSNNSIADFGQHLRDGILTLFIPQRIDRIERGSFAGGIKTEENSDHGAHAEGQKDRGGGNDGFEIGEHGDQF